MSKYQHEGYPDLVSVELNHIANELAEANRLKRWEIKLSHKEIKDTTIERDLEDQA